MSCQPQRAFFCLSPILCCILLFTIFMVVVILSKFFQWCYYFCGFFSLAAAAAAAAAVVIDIDRKKLRNNKTLFLCMHRLYFADCFLEFQYTIQRIDEPYYSRCNVFFFEITACQYWI